MLFGAASWLVALAVPPLLWLGIKAADHRAERRAQRLLGELAAAQREAWHPQTRGWQRFFFLTALCWLALALARPQWGASEVTVTQRGSDVVIALDVSRSMLAQDVAPSRLDRAQAELTEFLRRQTASRVGLVLFAGAAFVQCPLTTDLATAEIFLQMASPDMISLQGTALAAALRVSRELLQSGRPEGEPPGFQAILLITDGEDLEGQWEQEVELCRRLGITVIPVGIGEPTGGLIPVTDGQGRPAGFLKDADDELVLTRLDLATLERLAQIGGSPVFRIGQDGLAGERLRQELDHLGRRAFEDRRVTRYQDRSRWPLALALLHLLVALAIRPRAGTAAGRDAGGSSPGPSVGTSRPVLGLVLLVPVVLLVLLVLAGPVDAEVLRPDWTTAMQRGLAAYERADYELALREFELARTQAPQDPRLALAVGGALYHLGKLEEAAREFDRARALSHRPELLAESHYNAGTTALAQGDAEQAIAHLRESLRLEPGRTDALHNLESALLLARQQEQPQSQPGQDDQDQQDDQDRQDDQHQQGEPDRRDDHDRQGDQDPQEQPQPQEGDETPQEPGRQPDPRSADEPTPRQGRPDGEAEPPQMDLEQALQILRALDRDEQDLQRSVQQRLRGQVPRSGREW
jgi:Ca-activated chloride channel homolog